MRDFITQYKDYAEFFSYFITSLSLIGIWIAYAFSKKQMHFSTMEKCIRDYRDWIKVTEISADENATEYIDMVNEEFFYLENNYLPLEVGIEWVDGMIDFLPFYTKKNEFIKSRNLDAMEDEVWTNNLLYSYPRVFKAIKLKNKVEFEKVALGIVDKENREIRKKERNKLIYLVILNLNVSLCTKLKLKYRIIASC